MVEMKIQMKVGEIKRKKWKIKKNKYLKDINTNILLFFEFNSNYLIIY